VRPLRVLVVAADPLARAGLAALLSAEEDLVVAGRAEPSEDLVATSEAFAADIIAWDTGWQGEAALARLSEIELDIPVVALVSDEAEAAEALASGALGALRRNADAARISAALAAVARGIVAVDADFARALAPLPRPAPDPLLPPTDEPPLLEELTVRELEVLRLLAKGLPNKTIAQRLDISEHTVKFHVNSLLGKLDAGSRTEAVVRATRLGLILL
jgi:two-component system, NarL family, nitrate/nitrite response regulator NarL